MTNADDEALRRIKQRISRVTSEVTKEEGLEGCRVVFASLTLVSEGTEDGYMAFNIWNLKFRRDDGGGKTATISVEARPEKDNEAMKSEIVRKLREAEWKPNQDV